MKTRSYGCIPTGARRAGSSTRAPGGRRRLTDMGVHAIDTASSSWGAPPRRAARRSARALAPTTWTTRRSCSSAGTTAQTPSSNPAGGSPMPRDGGRHRGVRHRRVCARVRLHRAPNDTYEHCPQSMYTSQMNEFLDAIIEDAAQPDRRGWADRDAGTGRGLPLRRSRPVNLVLGVDGGARRPMPWSPTMRATSAGLRPTAHPTGRPWDCAAPPTRSATPPSRPSPRRGRACVTSRRRRLAWPAWIGVRFSWVNGVIDQLELGCDHVLVNDSMVALRRAPVISTAWC